MPSWFLGLDGRNCFPKWDRKEIGLGVEGRKSPLQSLLYLTAKVTLLLARVSQIMSLLYSKPSSGARSHSE